MFVTSENRRKVYAYLFQEGCIVIKKDVNGGNFDEKELPVRNLEVMKLLQSLASMKWATVTFNWSYFYYILTDKGITELRKFLCINDDVFPNTLTKPAEDTNAYIKSDRKPFERREGGDRPYGERREGGGRGEGGRGGRGRFGDRDGGRGGGRGGRGRGDRGEGEQREYRPRRQEN